MNITFDIKTASIRLFACLVDYFIVFAFTYVIAYLYIELGNDVLQYYLSTESIPVAILSITLGLFTPVILFGPFLVYYGYFISRKGQTPGMSLFQLRLSQRPSARPTIRQACFREFLKFIGFTTQIGFIIAAIQIYSRNHTWYDALLNLEMHQPRS